MKLAAPMTEAASTISEASQQVTTDPQKAVEAWQALTDAYKSASSSISNTDVKNAVDNLAKDAQAAADQLNVALGEDLGADGVKNIGKLAQLFGDDKKMGLKTRRTQE